MNSYADLHKTLQELVDIAQKHTIQLSSITAYLIEQNEKINSLTKPSEYIGTKELAKRYNISERSQKAYRGRVKNPLPYYQDIENGKITYKVSEVEEWKHKQKKR